MDYSKFDFNFLERPMAKHIIPILLFVGLFAGCSLHSGSTYERGEMGSPSTFKKGVVLSVRDVTIKGTESGAGAAAGATAGGLAGSTLGGNTATRALGGLGGAVIGGIVGHTTENVITGGDASEFVVQPDAGEPYAIVQVNDEELKAGERVLIIESGKLRIVRDNSAVK
jgi:outer membrane lipoprotein SlyB